MAVRFQRSRQFKPGIPAGAVYVGRPSQWGNPAKMGEFYLVPGGRPIMVNSRFIAVDLFYLYCRNFAQTDPKGFFDWIFPLIDKNLCCWCALNEPCHADVLLFLSRKIKNVVGLEDRFTRLSEGAKDWPPLSDFVKI